MTLTLDCSFQKQNCTKQPLHLLMSMARIQTIRNSLVKCFANLMIFLLKNAITGRDFNTVLNNFLEKLNGPPHKNTNARVEILNYMK